MIRMLEQHTKSWMVQARLYKMHHRGPARRNTVIQEARRDGDVIDAAMAAASSIRALIRMCSIIQRHGHTLDSSAVTMPSARLN
jgi:hypothetical protein